MDIFPKLNPTQIEKFISISNVVVFKKTDCFMEIGEGRISSWKSCTWQQPWIPQRQRA